MERLVDNVKVKKDTMKDTPLLGGRLISLRSQIEQINKIKQLKKESCVQRNPTSIASTWKTERVPQICN